MFYSILHYFILKYYFTLLERATFYVIFFVFLIVSFKHKDPEEMT
jgi:hypothetical protein